MLITKKSIIGIIKLAGIISTESRLGSRGGLNLNDLSDSITKAFSFKNMKAIVLLVNSPGGSPVQSALIANRIRDLKDVYPMTHGSWGKIENLNIYYDSSITLAKKFKLRGIPTSILFNKDGFELARILEFF